MHMEQVYKQGKKYSSSGMYKTRYQLERQNYKVLTFHMNFKYLISNFQFQNSYEISNVIDTLVKHFTSVADAFYTVRTYQHNWTTEMWFSIETLLVGDALLVVKPENHNSVSKLLCALVLIYTCISEHNQQV